MLFSRSRLAPRSSLWSSESSPTWLQSARLHNAALFFAFFALVGCHGLHVAIGLIWLLVMMVQVTIKRFSATVERRLHCFALFWHALDIVWVWLFTVVYLMGVKP